MTIRGYWVDFECWHIEAENTEDVEKQVMEKLKAGELPAITNIELTGEDEEEIMHKEVKQCK
jgi:hypothetical protein